MSEKTKNRKTGVYRPQHLLGIEGLSKENITTILDLAESYIEKNRQIDKKHVILKGRTLINLFFENSTRTDRKSVV